MPNTCVVPGCKTAVSKAPSHQFPKNCTRSREWQLVINSPSLSGLSNEELTRGRSYRVCYLHFSSEAYVKTKWQRRLKRDAVPSLHLNLTTSPSPDILDSSKMLVEDQQTPRIKETDSTSKKSKKDKKSKDAKKNRKKIGIRKASRRQRVEDALKLMKTGYFQELMSSRSRSDKLYAEMQQRTTLQRPSLELMKLCQNIAHTCPEYAHEYITNMLIK